VNVAWTGHRPDLFAEPAVAAAEVAAAAEALHAAHGTALRFHCGGQRGVDTWAAEAARRLAVPYPHYRPVQPAAFAAGWGAADRRVLDTLWADATERTVVDPSGTLGDAAYSRRNALLAAHADRLVAVWTGRGGGGTAETIALARARGCPSEEQLLPPTAHAPAAGDRGV
jgi:hypothetical protein